MPNYVANRITFLGKNGEEALRKYIKSKDNVFDFDFNAAIKMPEGMEKTVAGSITDKAVKVYLNYLYLNGAEDLTEKIELYKQGFSNAFYTAQAPDMLDEAHHTETLQAIFNQGKGYEELAWKEIDDVYTYAAFVLDCQAKYGAKDWYDWSRKYWGTKWNACDTEYKEGSNTVFFYTAWASVPDLVMQISKDNPNIRIEYKFAEEQAGYWAGFIIFEAGEIVTECLYSEECDESYELWGELWER